MSGCHEKISRDNQPSTQTLVVAMLGPTPSIKISLRRHAIQSLVSCIAFISTIIVNDSETNRITPEEPVSDR